MGLFGKKPAKPEKRCYGSLQWNAVMFRDWPELRSLPYWQQFRSNFRTQGAEGRAYVAEYTDISQMLVHRPEGASRHVPEPYLFTVVLPDGTPLTNAGGVESGALMIALGRNVPTQSVLLRHTTGMWPMFHVDVMRDAGDQLNAARLQLATAAPRLYR